MKTFLHHYIKFYLLIFSITSSIGLYAQSPDFFKKEEKLINTYSHLIEHIQDYDSISLYSDLFEKELTSLIQNNPGTLAYSFSKLNESGFCEVETSLDGNFRIY